MSNYNPTAKQPLSFLAPLITGVGILVLLFFLYTSIKASVTEIHRVRILSEVRQDGIVVLADNSTPSPFHEGKSLVLSGKLHVDAPLRDDDFHIEQAGLKLIREVQIYQTVKDVDFGGKKERQVYMADKMAESSTIFINEWCAAPVVTRPMEGAFHLSFEERQRNANEGSELFYQSKTMLPNSVRLGAYHVSTPIIQSEQWGKIARDFLLPQSQWHEKTFALGIAKEHALYLRKKGFTEQERATPEAYEPQIGDLRVRWRVILSDQEVTLFARQEGDRLWPIPTSADPYFVLERGVIDIPHYLAAELEAGQRFSSMMLFFYFFFFWGSYALILWGIRFGTRQSALWEGWMACYKKGSSALLSCLTLSLVYVFLILYAGDWQGLAWFGLAWLALVLGLGYYLCKKAINKGKTLVFSGPTRMPHNEDS